MNNLQNILIILGLIVTLSIMVWMIIDQAYTSKISKQIGKDINFVKNMIDSSSKKSN